MVSSDIVEKDAQMKVKLGVTTEEFRPNIKLISSALLQKNSAIKPISLFLDGNSYVILPQERFFHIVNGETGTLVYTIQIPSFCRLSSICVGSEQIFVGCRSSGIPRVLRYDFREILQCASKFKREAPKMHVHKFSMSFGAEELREEDVVEVMKVIADDHNKCKSTNVLEVNFLVHWETKNKIMLVNSTFQKNKKNYFVQRDFKQCLKKNDVEKDSVLDLLLRKGTGNILIVLKNSLICYESHSTKQAQVYVPVKLHHLKHIVNQPETTITCADLSHDGKDMALGFTSGHIRIFPNFWDRMKKFYKTQSKISIDKLGDVKLHWHSTAVGCLAYLSASILVSGGEEAVLCRWNVGYGSAGGGHTSFRPESFLPNLLHGPGGITHTVPLSDSNRVIVTGLGSNSIRMVSTHNNKILWTLSGFAHNHRIPETLNDEVLVKPVNYMDKQGQKLSCLSHYGGDAHMPILKTLPSSQYPIVSGLNGAPGFLHHFTPSSTGSSSSKKLDSQFFVSSLLECIPYNRISRPGMNKIAKPSLVPRTSHFEFSSSSNNGKVLVTVNETLSELNTLGRKVTFRYGDGDTSVEDYCSESTTLKFWARSYEPTKGRFLPYTLVAEMQDPHGPCNNISGITLSRDGNRLVTISSTEGAFRVWVNAGSSTTNHHRWKCQYKTSTPSSLSSKVCSGAMAFNSISAHGDEDECLLAVAYGDMIGIWDVSIGKEYPSLLRVVQHTDEKSLLKSEAEEEIIVEKIFFPCDADGKMFIVSCSKDSLRIQSPFPGVSVGWRYESKDCGVSFGDSESNSNYQITASEYIRSQNAVSIALADLFHGGYRIMIFNCETGTLIAKWGGKNYCSSSTQSQKDSFRNEKYRKDDYVIDMTSDRTGEYIYYATANGSMYSFSMSESKSIVATNAIEPRNMTDVITAPSLPVSFKNNSKKRKDAENLLLHTGNKLMDHQSWFSGVESSELPSLSRAFVNDVIGNTLKRAKLSSE